MANDAPRFQSSPAPWDGRYRYGSNQQTFISSFNPRPPRGTGATITLKELATDLLTKFQSSPAPWDGRYKVRRSSPHPHPPFQSSPAPWDGRYQAGIKHRLSEDIVSILARPVGRALRGTDQAGAARAVVSILARPVGRALPRSSSGRSRWTRFNPRPPRGTGATAPR